MWRAILLAFLGLAILVHSAAAQDEERREKEFQERALAQATGYRATIGDKQPRELTLVDKPVQRWTNPLGGRQAHGDVFLWTDRGRAAAVLSLYEYTDKSGVVHEHHEFCSLVREPLQFQLEDKVVWTPAEPGIELKPVPDAPPPAAAPRQRLKQMRDIAAQFSAEKTTREGETRPLRVLPQPLFRPELDDDQADSGLFAFVEATDPEAFLLLAAAGRDGKRTWEYALVRMNSIKLKASHKDKVVWEAPVLPWSQALNRKDLPYTAFTVR